MQKRFPDLICVGAQKAATTWLHQMLRLQPAFYLPAFKELNYFTQIHQPEIAYSRTHRAAAAETLKRYFVANPDHKLASVRIAEADFLGRPEVDDDWYGGVFARAAADQVCVEACPSYLHLPEVGARHLLRLNPSVKLLVFVRDPVDRAWSHIRMNVSRGLSVSIDALLTRAKSIKQYVDNSEYRNSISLWRSLTSPGQFSVMLYDDVVSEPAAVIARVYELVGVPLPDDLGPVNREVHKGVALDFPRELRAELMEQLEPQYEFLSTEFPEAVSRWLAKHRAALA
jgi:hypothetical protein